ncbi:MAG: NADH-quinone oxidoreductase subunit N [Elusimicrobia bacterium]|nr:NADH-quinone oxidoreductase subunit N [Elusimicrobiota bacterium]
MMSSVFLLLPELALTAGALALFLGDNGRGDQKKWAFSIAVFSLVVAGILALVSPNSSAFGVLTLDPLARFLKGVLSVSVLSVMGFCSGFSAFRSGEGGKPFSWGTFLGMMLLSTVGLFLLVSASDFLTILISIELVSLTSFVLTGYCREDKRASEAAIKYFLVGGFSTGFMVFGMSLLYGVTGSTQLSSFVGSTGASLPALPLAGALVFVLAGFGFKLAMAPFHLWAPDVYEGAPTPITAFLSVAPKMAAFGMLIRFFQGAEGSIILTVVALLSALTMTVGNLGALRQTNLKRLLAYSSIAQMGYVMMGLVAGGAAGGQSVLIYLAVYVVMNLGAFACVIAVTEDARSETMESFSGTAARSLPLALVTAVFLLSLTGLPPLAGFIGKFSLFSAALQVPGLVWLAVVGALNSVVSLVYYFSIVRHMFFGTPRQQSKPHLPAPVLAVVAAAGAFTLIVGVFPNLLVTVVRSVWP